MVEESQWGCRFLYSKEENGDERTKRALLQCPLTHIIQRGAWSTEVFILCPDSDLVPSKSKVYLTHYTTRL